MIKRSLIKNTSFKKIKKITKRNFKKEFKEFKGLFGFLILLHSIENKSTSIDDCFKKLQSQGCFSDLKNIIKNEKLKTMIKQSFESDSTDARQLQEIINSSKICQNASDETFKELILNSVLFYFNILKNKKTFFGDKTKIFQKYLSIHKNIYKIARENYPGNLNEIMVFINLTNEVFCD